MKKALITGVSGQDGAYLAKFLLDQGYFVFGTVRRTNLEYHWRICELDLSSHEKFQIIEYNFEDYNSTLKLVEFTEPCEIYNLAAQSVVGLSNMTPFETGAINGLSVVWLLESIRELNPSIKFYQASTSEMFGNVKKSPQTETTPFHPRNPYGVSKLYAHWMVVNYRETHNLFAASGILFNHESPLRGLDFVTRKITNTIAQISSGRNIVLNIGNINAKRDWGYAKEYVEGMYLMLQEEIPDTFVLATNRSHSVKDFINLTCKSMNLELEWHGEGIDEIAINALNGNTIVRTNRSLYRKNEFTQLVGDASKAREKLGWRPKVTLDELCEIMVRADLDRIQDTGS